VVLEKIGSHFKIPDLGKMGGKWEVNGTFAENYGTFCTLNT
jgi:hypothetical protein